MKKTQKKCWHHHRCFLPTSNSSNSQSTDPQDSSPISSKPQKDDFLLKLKEIDVQFKPSLDGLVGQHIPPKHVCLRENNVFNNTKVRSEDIGMVEVLLSIPLRNLSDCHRMPFIWFHALGSIVFYSNVLSNMMYCKCDGPLLWFT